MIVIFSIRPRYCKAILNGTKKYEFRKVVPKEVDEVDKYLIYCTSPVQKFVGEFTVKEVFSGHPSDIWEKCRDFAGIEKKSFNRYFQNREMAFALSIEDIHSFHPIDPWSIQSDFTPPQSFKYVRDSSVIEQIHEFRQNCNQNDVVLRSIS
ncbi:MAG: hypothetical protein KGY80_10320 [Candidatus Thorarchaeota archaeon]|nr:hypothetical protein [Candidatus Thorarchaeota archaeon]